MGGIIKREISSHEYYYLHYRDNGKVKSKYLGRVNEYNIDGLEIELKQRKNIEGILKRLVQENAEIKSILGE